MHLASFWYNFDLGDNDYSSEEHLSYPLLLFGSVVVKRIFPQSCVPASDSPGKSCVRSLRQQNSINSPGYTAFFKLWEIAGHKIGSEDRVIPWLVSLNWSCTCVDFSFYALAYFKTAWRFTRTNFSSVARATQWQRVRHRVVADSVFSGYQGFAIASRIGTPAAPAPRMPTEEFPSLSFIHNGEEGPACGGVKGEKHGQLLQLVKLIALTQLHSHPKLVIRDSTHPYH